MQTAWFDPHPGLFWFYLIIGMALLSMAGIMAVAWGVRRDSYAGLLSILFLWLTVDALAKGILRSPQAIVTQEQILYVSRVASVGIVTSAALVLDAYLASRNEHLSGLRRLVLWYRNIRGSKEDRESLQIKELVRDQYYYGYDRKTLVREQDHLGQSGGVFARVDGLHPQRRADWRN